MTDTLLDTLAVPSLFGLTEGTLRKWRLSGQGPKYVKLGVRSVRYRRSDVEAFLDSHSASSTAQADLFTEQEVDEAI